MTVKLSKTSPCNKAWFDFPTCISDTSGHLNSLLTSVLCMLKNKSEEILAVSATCLHVFKLEKITVKHL